MAIQAAEHQKTLLLGLIKKLAETPYGRHFNLSDLPKAGELDALHSAFAERVPVVNTAMWRKALLGLYPQSNAQNPIEPFRENGCLLEMPVAFVEEDNGGFMPVSQSILKSFQTVEKELPAHIRKQWPELGKGTWFYICDDAIIEYHDKLPAGDLLALQMEHKGMLLAQRAIAPDLTDIQSVGRSRAQALLVYADELQKCGKSIHTLVASAKTLTDMCFLLAQREGKFIPLKALCPNLKLYLCTDDLAVHDRELQYFFAGLEMGILTWMARPYGLQAWQQDLDARGVMALPTQDGIFYEFIPVTDVDAQGRLKKEFQRLHAAQTTPGKDYLLVVTTAQGLLAYQTGDIVRMHDREPMTFLWRRRLEALNGFSEYLVEDTVNRLIEAFNDALQPYGFFIRDYMVGDRAGDRCPHWVIEISRPPKDVPEKVLQSVVNRLHREIGNELPAYLAAFRNNRTFPPSMHFVPMGTFTHMPSPFKFRRFDGTAEAEVIEQVLARAGQQAVHLRGPLL